PYSKQHTREHSTLQPTDGQCHLVRSKYKHARGHLDYVLVDSACRLRSYWSDRYADQSGKYRESMLRRWNELSKSDQRYVGLQYDPDSRANLLASDSAGISTGRFRIAEEELERSLGLSAPEFLQTLALGLCIHFPKLYLIPNAKTEVTRRG